MLGLAKCLFKCRNGDLPTAFEIVDEMLSNRIVPDVSTFSHLMIACINDKEAGFKLVVEVCFANTLK